MDYDAAYDINNFYEFANNLKKLENIINLNKLNIQHIDYSTILMINDLQPKKIEDLKKRGTGYFINDEGLELKILSQSKYFDEAYILNGKIKFIREYDFQKNKINVKDTYFGQNIETILIYETNINHESREEQYPLLKLSKEDILWDIQEQERIDIIQEYNEEYDEDDEDDEDEYEYFDQEIMADYCCFTQQEQQEYAHFKYTKGIQRKLHTIGNFELALLIHDTQQNFELCIQSTLGELLSNKYNVKTNNLITIKTKMNYKDIKKIDEELEKNKDCKNLINYLTQTFENHEATIINNKKSRKTRFLQAIKQINLL